MRIIKNFLSFILSFLLMILVIVLIYVFNISSFASKEKMIKNVGEVDFPLELQKVRNSGKVSEGSKITNTINDLYNLAGEFDVKSEDIDKIINSKIAKKIIGIPLGNMTDYIINDKKNNFFSSEDIYNIINEEIDDVLKESNIDVSEGQKEKFLSRIKLELPDLVESIPSTEDILKGKNKNIIDISHFVFGDLFKIIVIIISFVLIILLILTERKKCTEYIGFSLLFASLLSVGVSFFIPGIIMELVNGADVSLLINPFVSLLSRNIINWSIVVLFLSIIILLLSKDINRLDS